MTACFNSLTPEVHLNILYHIESYSQLAQCRLVCKALDPLAEKTMYSQCMRITSYTQMEKLQEILTLRPSLAQRIPALEFNELFEDDSDADLSLLKSFLQVAMRSNITSITGKFDPAPMAILSKSVQTIVKLGAMLKQLPTEHRYHKGYEETLRSYSGHYKRMVEASSHFLESLDIEINPEPGSLLSLARTYKKYPKLAHVKVMFNKSYDYAEDLERLLGQCHHLNTLKIEQTRHVDVGVVSKEEWHEWLVKDVKQIDSPIRVTTTLFLPDVMEYLAYKYPNMEYLELDVCSRDNDYLPAIERCLHAIQHIKKIRFECWILLDALTTASFTRFMKGNNCNRITIQIGDIPSIDGYGEAVVTKNNKTGATEFDFTFEIDCPTHQIMAPLDQFDTITYLDMNLSAHQEFHFYCVDGLDKVENLTLSVVILKRTLPEEAIHYNKFKVLKSLTIVNTFIAQEALEYLDRNAPNLKRLTLDCCYVEGDLVEKSFDQVINMPHTTLSTLSIITSAEFYCGHDSTMIESKWIAQSSFLKYRPQAISLQITSMSSARFPVQYFLLKCGEKSTCERICKEKFQDESRDWSAITVICKSLGTLCFDLGSLKLKLVSGSDGEFNCV